MFHLTMDTPVTSPSAWSVLEMDTAPGSLLAPLQMRGFKEADGRGLRALPRQPLPRTARSGGPRCRWPQEGAGLLPSAPAQRTVASGGWQPGRPCVRVAARCRSISWDQTTSCGTPDVSGREQEPGWSGGGCLHAQGSPHLISSSW